MYLPAPLYGLKFLSQTSVLSYTRLHIQLEIENPESRLPVVYMQSAPTFPWATTFREQPLLMPFKFDLVSFLYVGKINSIYLKNVSVLSWDLSYH